MDKPRFLAAKSEHGYVDDLRKAVHDEPECVSASEQAEMTRRVHQAERDRQLRAAAETQARVSDAVESYLASRPPRQLQSSARAVQRSANALVENARRVL